MLTVLVSPLPALRPKPRPAFAPPNVAARGRPRPRFIDCDVVESIVPSQIVVAFLGRPRPRFAGAFEVGPVLSVHPAFAARRGWMQVCWALPEVDLRTGRGGLEGAVGFL